MTIRTLVKKLQKCENQNATVHIVCGTDDDDVFDTTVFRVFSDHSGDGYQDLFVPAKKVGL
jgi:hypothetical protein